MTQVIRIAALTIAFVSPVVAASPLPSRSFGPATVDGRTARQWLLSSAAYCSQRFERTVDRDKTVSFHNLILQIEPTVWRGTMAGCKMIVNQHMDATITLTIGTRRVGQTARMENS